MTSANVLITGGAGQVGRELLARHWPASIALLAPSRERLDLTDGAAVEAFFQVNPISAIVNTAAYTAVDQAEDDVAGAFAANAAVPAILSDMARRHDIPLVHVSTDYVFDGTGEGSYDEADVTSPLGVYGASKRAGELAVLSGCRRSVILRTAWVVSPHRSNFVKTMLRLGASRPSLGVVSDQWGCPTSAADIAQTLVTIVLKMMADRQAPAGVYHFVNQGAASWFDLAAHVFAEANMPHPPILNPISTADYPTRARRPANSRLATTRIESDYGIYARPWREAIGEVVRTISQKDITA